MGVPVAVPVGGVVSFVTAGDAIDADQVELKYKPKY